MFKILLDPINLIMNVKLTHFELFELDYFNVTVILADSDSFSLINFGTLWHSCSPIKWSIDDLCCNLKKIPVSEYFSCEADDSKCALSCFLFPPAVFELIS